MKKLTVNTRVKMVENEYHLCIPSPYFPIIDTIYECEGTIKSILSRHDNTFYEILWDNGKWIFLQFADLKIVNKAYNSIW